MTDAKNKIIKKQKMPSAEESTSLENSTICSPPGTGQNLKTHKSKQWEINLMGNFLLTLYHRLVIGPQDGWNCEKTDIQNEFEQFVTPDLIKRLNDDDIGNLLHRCGFLLNPPTDSSSYKLKSEALFEFRYKKLKEQDKRRTNHDAGGSSAFAGPEDILRNLTEHEKVFVLQANYEIDEDSPKHDLQYQGTTMQTRRPNYQATNMGCFICQLDFATMEGYEEHIQTHNSEKEFEYLNELSQFESPIFTVSYRLCKNSHHFCFAIESRTDNLVIEKIIIVQSRSMVYVHNMRVPYAMPANGCDHFYVDSHLFAMFVEQPIVLIGHQQDSKDTRIIEEHHFMRVLEFPKVNFAIKPYRLPASSIFKTKFKLPEYFPPLEIREALKEDLFCEKLMETTNEFRDYVQSEKSLQAQTMGPTLTTLLCVEDMDTINDYLKLIQYNVQLRSFGDDYSMRLNSQGRLNVESVLSVFDDAIITTRQDIRTDSESLVQLILQNIEDQTITDTFIGRIEDINAGRVSFKCYKRLDLHRTYTIIFRPSRLQLRYQYRALTLLPEVMPFLEKFLFPETLLPKPPSNLSLDLYNTSIYNNPDQLQAVRNIAEGPRNDATYIIFGPPGTGKTTTLVESILQVLKRGGTKILVTASSNSACDEVALRLCKAMASIDISRAIVRIYARSNEARIDTIDDVLLEHSNMYNGHFYPDIEVLHEYRIVVCTMAVAAKLTTGKFGRSKNGGTLYSHMFIDEVAASTEVEALMAITTILTSKSCLIIAGDHKQLGPILKSKRAEELKLGASLMDRLLERACYRVNSDTGDYDRSIQSRLRQNFRSHPAIVHLYSGMYYDRELEAKAKIDDVSLGKRWHLAPSKDFPIIFHSIQGKTYSDNQSFSLYNSDEINIVMDYVKDLMYFGINGKPVRECDIGVISPYKRQYLRIREELNLRKWYQIETGSVETYQGKEKDIIIVSFVRSGTSALGFLESPRRLNVTLSRAKSLLILIGNAKTLAMNPDYDHIIKECQLHKTLIERFDHETSLSAADDQARMQRSGYSRHKPSTTDMGSTMYMVNQTLKDLTTKNESLSKARGPRGGKNKKFNNPKTDEETGATSIAKATGKSKLLLQASQKKNQGQTTRGAGKISKSYRNRKPNVSNGDTKATLPSTMSKATEIQKQQLLQAIIRKLNSQIFSPAAATTQQVGGSIAANNKSESDQKSEIVAAKTKKIRHRRLYIIRYNAKGKQIIINRSPSTKAAKKNNPTQTQAVDNKNAKKAKEPKPASIKSSRAASTKVPQQQQTEKKVPPKAASSKVQPPPKMSQQQQRQKRYLVKVSSKVQPPVKLPQQQQTQKNVSPNTASSKVQPPPKVSQQQQTEKKVPPKAASSKVQPPPKMSQQQQRQKRYLVKVSRKVQPPVKLPQQQQTQKNVSPNTASSTVQPPPKVLQQQQIQKKVPLKAASSKVQPPTKLPQQQQSQKKVPSKEASSKVQPPPKVSQQQQAQKKVPPKAASSKVQPSAKLPQQQKKVAANASKVPSKNPLIPNNQKKTDQTSKLPLNLAMDFL